MRHQSLTMPDNIHMVAPARDMGCMTLAAMFREEWLSYNSLSISRERCSPLQSVNRPFRAAGPQHNLHSHQAGRQISFPSGKCSMSVYPHHFPPTRRLLPHKVHSVLQSLLSKTGRLIGARGRGAIGGHKEQIGNRTRQTSLSIRLANKPILTKLQRQLVPTSSASRCSRHACPAFPRRKSLCAIRVYSNVTR
jgi:hypothetical protein